MTREDAEALAGSADGNRVSPSACASVAEHHEIAARYAVWEIIGEPEYRRPIGGAFNPWS